MTAIFRYDWKRMGEIRKKNGGGIWRIKRDRR